MTTATNKKASAPEHALHDALTSPEFHAELRACKNENEKRALHALVCEEHGVKPGPNPRAGAKKRARD